MEGAVEDHIISDSLELADVDDSMTRLRVSSASPSAAPDFVEEAPAAVGLSSSPAAGTAGVSGVIAGQVDQFLREALEKPRERLSILRMEQDIEKFLHDATQQQMELRPLLNSYLRLAAYRIAQHYGLQSSAVPDSSTPDGSSSRIVVRKTSECHPMPIRLADIPFNLPQDDSHGIVRVAIKQRPQKQSQSINSGNTVSSKIDHSQSVEERKEEYNRARARIFSNNSSSDNQGKSESKAPLRDSFRHNSVVSTPSEDNSCSEGPEINVALGFGYPSPSGGSSRSRVRAEKEPVVNGFEASSRVAIFRDREMDRKDPDYDRNYDRLTNISLKQVLDHLGLVNGLRHACACQSRDLNS